MKCRNLFKSTIIVLFLVLISQNAFAGWKSTLGEYLIKGFEEEIADVHKSIPPDHWVYYKISLKYKDALTTFIEVSNEEPISIDLIDEESYQKYKNGDGYEYYTAYHGTGIIKDRFRMHSSEKTDSEKKYYLIIRNNSINGKNSNVKIQIYKDVHDEFD